MTALGVFDAKARGSAPSNIEPLRIERLVEPSHPLSMTVAGVRRGEVDLVLGVDAQGGLDDFLVTAYSRPEFATEAVRALKQWKFSPMRVDGTPVWSRARLAFHFEATGAVVTRTVVDSVDMLGGEMLERTRHVRVLSRQSELDRPLALRQSVPPPYPARLADKKIPGAVMVEFFVDEEGRARLPVADGDAHPWFADAAAQAVLRWRFEPPLKKGRPTVVQVRQPFVFNP